MVQSAALVLRDFETDGVPASGTHNVDKRELRELLVSLESNIGSRAPDLWMRDVKAAGTDAGTFTAGSFVQRTLNTVERNSRSDITAGSNQFRLPVGVWAVAWKAPAYQVNSHKSRIYDYTNSNEIEAGSTERAGASDDVVTWSEGFAVLTLGAAATFQIEHRCGTTKATSGFGKAANLGTDEVYAEVRVWRVDDVPSIAGDLIGGAVISRFVFSNSVADSDPSSGRLRLNNSTQNLATKLYVSNSDADGIDVSAIIDQFDDSTSSIKGYLRLVSTESPGSWLLFQVTLATSATGYRKVTLVSMGGSSASPFASGDQVHLVFTRNGDKGTTGAAGSNGAAGATGATGPTGAPGLGTFKGTWSNATAYVTADVVYKSGLYYIALQAGTNRDPATQTAYWSIVAFSGARYTVAPAGSRGSYTADYVTDGTADDVQIQAAIDAAEGAGGGVVELLGAFSVDHNIIGKTGVHLVGKASVTPSASYTALTISGQTINGVVAYVARSNFSISGLTIDCRTNDKLQNGIIAVPDDDGGVFAGTPCENFRIFDNVVKCKKGHAYHIWAVRGINGSIDHNTIDGGYSDADTWTGGESQEGIELYGCDGVRVHDNYITGVGNAGINLPSLMSTTPLCGIDRAIVHDNHIDTCGRGILSYLESDTVNGALGMVDTIIANNTLRNIKVDGIAIEVISEVGFGDPVPFKRNSVLDNIVRMADSGQTSDARAFALNNQMTLTDIESEGNVIARNKFFNGLNTNAAGRANLVLFSGFDFNDNWIKSEQASGSSIGLLMVNCADFRAVQNVIYGARSYGVEIQGCVRFRVNSNVVLNWNGSAAGAPGVVVASANGVDTTEFEITGNRFKTDTLDSVGALVSLDSACSEGVVRSPNNYYANDDFTAAAVAWAGSDATLDRGRVPGAIVAKASGALTAGQFVNITTDAGAAVARAASSSFAREADGFVLASVADGVNVTVYTQGVNYAVGGQTPGATAYLSTAGGAQSSAPVTTGHLVQTLGKAISATEIFFRRSDGSLVP